VSTATAIRRSKPRGRQPQHAPTRKKTLSRTPSVPSDLPGWEDLARPNRQSLAVDAGGPLDSTTLIRYTGYVLLAALAVTLYVGHVNATEHLYANVHTLQKENLRLHMQRDQLKGHFDRLTGPTVIYRQAQELGLEEGYAYGPTILLEP
jgi:hypothetical protein